MCSVEYQKDFVVVDGNGLCEGLSQNTGLIADVNPYLEEGEYVDALEQTNRSEIVELVELLLC